MKYLLDTKILLRWTQIGDSDHAVAVEAVYKLKAKGEEMFIASQNIIEFWNVATRPLDKNGLGMSISEADKSVIAIEKMFPILAESAQTYTTWRR